MAATHPKITTWEAYAKELGMRLQRHRLAAGLSQEELAHRSGVTRNYYQQVERGYLASGKPSNPSLKVLLALARQLKTDLPALLPSDRDLAVGDSR